MDGAVRGLDPHAALRAASRSASRGALRIMTGIASFFSILTEKHPPCQSLVRILSNKHAISAFDGPRMPSYPVAQVSRMAHRSRRAARQATRRARVSAPRPIRFDGI